MAVFQFNGILHINVAAVLTFSSRSGLEIATNTVAFATEFLPFATKISGEVVNLRLIICDLFSSSLFRNERVNSCHFAALFTKINEEMTKLFCFSA